MAYLLKKFPTFIILTIILALFSNNLIEISLAQTSNCDSCDKVNKLLEPCNDTLIVPSTSNETNTIVEANYFVDNSKEAKCWCSEEFYDLLLNCTTCLSSPSLNTTIEPLDEYKNSCKKYGTEFKEESSPISHKGPSGLALALCISALVTILASLVFCICFIRNRKKKSLAYEELKTDFNYSSKGRGIEIGGRNIVSENDEKELYTPSTAMPPPPPAAHQLQPNDQQQQLNDQNKQNPYRIHTETYGQQQFYVDASQSQVPTNRDSYEYSENTDDVNVVNVNNSLSSQYVYQHYPE